MRPPFWQSVALDTPVEDLVDVPLLILPTDHTSAVVATIGHYNEGSRPVRSVKASDLDSPPVQRDLSGGTLADVVRLVSRGTGHEAIALPPVDWAGRAEGLRLQWPVTILVGVIVVVLLVLPGLPVLAGSAIPIAAAAAAITWSLLRRRRPTRIRTAGDLRLDSSNLVDYAIARRLGERPEALTDDQRRGRITARMDAVRAEYARLSADIVYRIEASALFDPASTPTKSFEVALVRADTEAGSLTLDDLDELATELKIAFSVARDHAGTVGIGHLPATEREDARRASKAARLASRAATEGEREAALARVVRILDALALHYLPAPDTARRQLTTGAQSSETAASDV